MSLREEWQLVAHNKDLTAAEGAVAQAIARRIKPGQTGEALPIRTLLAESVGVTSKSTIELALRKLEALGVIRVSKPPKGSRKPSVITWSLECPGDCQLDHSKANSKLSQTYLERQFEEAQITEPPLVTRPDSQDTTRPDSQDTLRSKELEREGLLSFIEKTLTQVESPNPNQELLLAGLRDKEKRQLIQFNAEQLALKAEQNSEGYLKAIVLNSPQKLLPKPAPIQSPPDYSHLPRELQDAYRRLDLERAVS